MRAELLVSGSGRWRMFRALSEGDRGFAGRLSAKEARDLEDPATAGEVIFDDVTDELTLPKFRRLTT